MATFPTQVKLGWGFCCPEDGVGPIITSQRNPTPLAPSASANDGADTSGTSFSSPATAISMVKISAEVRATMGSAAEALRGEAGEYTLLARPKRAMETTVNKEGERR
jgi:hypothetical protein